MSKKLGPVTPPPPPVDPFKNKTAPGIGVVVSNEVTAKADAPPPGLGTVRTDTPVVTVNQAAPEAIGQLKQTVVAAPPPPPPPPPVGVIREATPTVFTSPVHEGAAPVGVVRQVPLEAPFSPAPASPPTVIETPPPMYPPPPPPAQPNIGKIVDNVVSVVPPVPTDKPQVVVSIVQKPKPIVEQPVEISPFKNPDE